MADLGDFSSQPESSNFDNDFEKLDPLAPGSDDLVSSSTQKETPESDLYSSTPLGRSGETERLLDLDEPLIPAVSPPEPPAPSKLNSSEAVPAPSKEKKAAASSSGMVHARLPGYQPPTPGGVMYNYMVYLDI